MPHNIDMFNCRSNKLDCGHYYQLHPLSNTMVIHCDGTTECSNCYD